MRSKCCVTVTCWQYSRAMRLAHSTHRLTGRAGFETSAHLIIIRLMSVRFSGWDRRRFVDSWRSIPLSEPVPLSACTNDHHHYYYSGQLRLLPSAPPEMSTNREAFWPGSLKPCDIEAQWPKEGVWASSLHCTKEYCTLHFTYMYTVYQWYFNYEINLSYSLC